MRYSLTINLSQGSIMESAKVASIQMRRRQKKRATGEEGLPYGQRRPKRIWGIVASRFHSGYDMAAVWYAGSDTVEEAMLVM